MEIYDISQEIFTSRIYPGDPEPETEAVLSFDKEKPDLCRLSKMTLGSHTGTHIDAPSHFCRDGKTINEVELEKCVGDCKVVEACGEVTAGQIRGFLEDGTKRLLIKGDILLTLEAAKEMTEKGVKCLGVEGLTVGPEHNPRKVHLELLGNEVVIIEGLCMKGISEGYYLLAAQPLKLGGVDGSPVRAILCR